MRWTLVVATLAACHPPVDADDSVTLPSDTPMPLSAAVEARVDTILAAADLATQAKWMTGDTLLPRSGTLPPSGRAYTTPGDSALGVPGFRMTDGPRGMTLERSTVFPTAIGRAASWDTDLERRIGEAIGQEVADHGANVLLAPCVNIVRHPGWGRTQESYGEDPVLMGRMGVAFVQGAQEHVLATAKHFAANSIEDNRYQVDVSMDARTLHEVYLPHFRELVREADVAAVMSAYNQLNGDYTGESRSLLTDVLRTDWGFQGPVMSDWLKGVYDGPKALKAGLDIEMPTASAYAELATFSGGADAIHAAARRIVRRQLEYGLDTAPGATGSDVRSPAHFALAREAAAKSMVLLKNDGALLPLVAGALTRVAVVGVLADTVNVGDNGSSNVDASGVVTPLAGLIDALDAERVSYSAGAGPSELTAIAAADVAIVVVGLTAADEGEGISPNSAGDRETLGLDAAQIALIQAVAAANPSTIVVLEGGSAITVEEWIDDVPALLLAWYPGQRGGEALADVLLGATAPSGRMPLTVPRTAAQLPDFAPNAAAVTYGYLHGYRWVDRQDEDVRFPFGFGLSTTTFTLEDLSVEGQISGPEDSITVSVTVKNTGLRAGAQVVQLYLEPLDAALDLPDRVLAAFGRVELDAQAAATVSLTVNARAFATWDQDVWRIRPGGWNLAVGTSSRDLPLVAPFEVLDTRGKP